MTAWEQLKANSALLFGTAWQLLTHPKQTGQGVVVNDGVAVSVELTPISVELPESSAQIEIAANVFEIEVEDTTQLESGQTGAEVGLAGTEVEITT